MLVVWFILKSRNEVVTVIVPDPYLLSVFVSPFHQLFIDGIVNSEPVLSKLR